MQTRQQQLDDAFSIAMDRNMDVVKAQVSLDTAQKNKDISAATRDASQADTSKLTAIVDQKGVELDAANKALGLAIVARSNAIRTLSILETSQQFIPG